MSDSDEDEPHLARLDGGIALRVTVAQLDPLVGDIEGNVARLIRVLAESRADRPDLVVCPEMYLGSYQDREPQRVQAACGSRPKPSARGGECPSRRGWGNKAFPGGCKASGG